MQVTNPSVQVLSLLEDHSGALVQQYGARNEWSKVGVKKGIQGLSTETAYTMQGQYLKYGSGHFVEREKAGVKRAELATIPGDLVEGWARVASK